MVEPSFYCHEVLHMCPGPSQFKELDTKEYTKKLLSLKPLIIQNNDYINQLYKQIKPNGKTLKFV